MRATVCASTVARAAPRIPQLNTKMKIGAKTAFITTVKSVILIAFCGWVFGTYLGAAAGMLLPHQISDALGIALYGMFLAIIIPPARKSRGILVAILLSAACSTLLYYCIKSITAGFAMILSAVLAAVVAAILFPAPSQNQTEQEASAV